MWDNRDHRRGGEKLVTRLESHVSRQEKESEKLVRTLGNPGTMVCAVPSSSGRLRWTYSILFGRDINFPASGH